MTEFIFEQNKLREDYKKKPKKNNEKSLYNKIFSYTSLGILLSLLFAISVPVLVYYFLYNNNDDKYDNHTCAVDKIYKIQCGGVREANETYCEDINCCYDSTTKTCYHYLPSKYYYYSENDDNLFIPSLPQTPFGNENFDNITLTINEIDENRLSIILHQSQTKIQSTKQIETKNYFYKIYNDRGAVEVFRNTKELLLTTAIGPLIVSQNYWDWSFQLNDTYLFGLGETLIELDENSTLNKVIYSNTNDHSSLPIFMTVNNGKFHGVIVRHQGPLEVTVLPSKLVNLKSLSGDRVELELAIGPTIKQLLEQQGKLTNVQVPNDWILGTHLCRGGSEIKLDKILDTFASVSATYDSDCIHENLLLAILTNEDSSLVTRLQTVVKELVKTRQFVLSLPPQIPEESSLYKQTKDTGIYYKNENGTDYIGTYLSLRVAYPYYQHPKISDFIKILLDTIEKNLGFVPTNLIFNNNWPTNDNYTMSEDNELPYLSKDIIDAMSHTIPWDALGNERPHILDHNDYGMTQLQTIGDAIKARTNQAIFTMTSSHNLATQSSPVLSQTSYTTWNDFRSTIKKLLFNSLFVTPFASGPVCGSTKYYDAKLNESLCIRWYLMAATMPLLRLSSDNPQRDPDSLASGYAINLAKSAINKRNRFKSHYATTIFNGDLWMRPMFYDFENDPETYSLYSQYMIGDQILIAHPILPDVTQLWIYLPPTYEIWYEFWGGISYNATNSSRVLFDIVETEWISFIPEGKIIHLIEEDTKNNKNSIKLYVALKCDDLNQCESVGNWLIGTTLLKLKATQDSIKIDGMSDEIRSQMGCNAKAQIVEELYYYKPESPTLLFPNVDLCKSADIPLKDKS